MHSVFARAHVSIHIGRAHTYTCTNKHTTTEYNSGHNKSAKSKVKAGVSLQMFAANCVQPVDALNIHDLRLTAIISEPRLSKDTAQLHVQECIIYTRALTCDKRYRGISPLHLCAATCSHDRFPACRNKIGPLCDTQTCELRGCVHACISLYKVRARVFAYIKLSLPTFVNACVFRRSKVNDCKKIISSIIVYVPFSSQDKYTSSPIRYDIDTYPTTLRYIASV